MLCQKVRYLTHNLPNKGKALEKKHYLTWALHDSSCVNENLEEKANSQAR